MTTKPMAGANSAPVVESGLSGTFENLEVWQDAIELAARETGVEFIRNGQGPQRGRCGSNSGTPGARAPSPALIVFARLLSRKPAAFINLRDTRCS